MASRSQSSTKSCTSFAPSKRSNYTDPLTRDKSAGPKAKAKAKLPSLKDIAGGIQDAGRLKANGASAKNTIDNVGNIAQTVSMTIDEYGMLPDKTVALGVGKFYSLTSEVSIPKGTEKTPGTETEERQIKALITS